MSSKKFNPGQRQLWRISTDLCEYAILYENIKYHRHISKYVYLTYKTWPHNLEWPLTILTQHECNYGKSAHFLNYPLSVHISHVHVCRVCPSHPMTQQNNAKGGTQLMAQYVPKCETPCAPNANTYISVHNSQGMAT